MSFRTSHSLLKSCSDCLSPPGSVPMLFLQRLCLAQLPLPHQIPFSPLALPPMPSSWNALSPAVSMVGSSSFRSQLTCHLLRVPPITASLELLPQPLPLITLPWFAAFIDLDDSELVLFHLLKALPSEQRTHQFALWLYPQCLEQCLHTVGA